jgi:hypothetical protein
MCPCDRLNGHVCFKHCTAPDVCYPRDHVDLCLGQLPASRSALSQFWQLGVTVTPDMAEAVGAAERALR